MAVKIISAGAGSGKTYRLTQEMYGLLRDGNVRASGIIATTFTAKAAGELAERVRTKLLEENLTHAANDLANALIGTVHGLGVKLLKRFAFEAGLSPQVDIIADEDQKVFFNLSLSQVLTLERIEKVDNLAQRLGFFKNQKNSTDWRDFVRQITEIARANNFGHDVLAKSKELSFKTFEKYLKDEETDNSKPPLSMDEYLATFSSIIQTSIENIENNTADNTKTTVEYVNNLKTLRFNLTHKKTVDWYEIVKLTKSKPGAKSKSHAESIQIWANRHLELAEFGNDIKNFIYEMFDIAANALEEYANFKRIRGLIDYTDMEVEINHLLDHPSVQAVLHDELDLLLVDEFQDTSPIQLEIFLKLSRIAKNSIWVGDPKQSIYGFRGAEPRLMQEIIRHYGIDPANILDKSWRSRKNIVNITNAIFAKAFADEMPIEQIALSSVRPDPTPQSALSYWHLKFDSTEKRTPANWGENALAHSLKIFLEESAEGKNIILPKGEKLPRNAQAGDIAILCRTNSSCVRVAEALHRAGLKAAIARAGLLNTTEVKLALSCLRYLFNRHDSLAVAEILLLVERKPIAEILEHRFHFLDELDKDASSWKWALEEPYILKINDLRRESAELSTFEMLNLVVEELDLRRVVASWGNAETRLENLDLLRSLSRQYEENCQKRHAAASIGGFLLYIKDLEQQGKDEQAAGTGADAINVLTYHRSKGLEYAVTICHDLAYEPRVNVFDFEIVPEADTVDLTNLLGNRWLRFWVNPYADQWKKTELAERLEAERLRKWELGAREEARLLYVGITRARDFLILPQVADKPTLALNYAYHRDAERPTLEAGDETIFEWQGKILHQEYRAFPFGHEFEYAEATPPQYIPFLEERRGKFDFIPYKIESDKENPVKYGITNFNFEGKSYSDGLMKLELSNSYLVSRCLVTFLNGLDYLGNDFSVAAKRLDLDLFLERMKLQTEIQTYQMMRCAEDFERLLRNELNVKNLIRRLPMRHHIEKRLFEADFDFWGRDTEGGYFLLQNYPTIGDLKKVKNEVNRQLVFVALAKETHKILFGKNCVVVLNFPFFGTFFKF